MLTIAITSAVLLLLAAVIYYAVVGRNLGEREAVVLFETRIDPPYLRPVFTARGEHDFHLDASVVHARLLSGVLHLTLRSDAGGEAVGFEVAITNVELDWLRGESYRYFTPECQLLVGPLPQLSDRFIERTARLHDLDVPEGGLRHVQAYAVTAVICDPADDSIRVEVDLPDGRAIRLTYDYAAATVHATLPTAALVNPENVQPLALRVAA